MEPRLGTTFQTPNHSLAIWNITVAEEIVREPLGRIKPLLSARQYIIIVAVLAYTSLTIGIVGIVSNILVIVTYVKMGFSETINISYVALGISDLSVVIIRTWGAIGFIFVVTRTELPFDPADLSAITFFWPGQGFEKTTAFVTAFIALERCLCVKYPLQVRRIVTRRKTIVTIVLIYFFAFGPSNFVHLRFRPLWRFNPARNRSILGLLRLDTPTGDRTIQALFNYYGNFLHFTALGIVWVCTIFLAASLKKNADARKETLKLSTTSQSDRKESHVVKVVFTVAAAYLVLSTPITVTLLVPPFVPEFNTRGALARTCFVVFLVSTLLSHINSSINLFIFMYMGSKFRNTFLKLLGYKKKRDV